MLILLSQASLWKHVWVRKSVFSAEGDEQSPGNLVLVSGFWDIPSYVGVLPFHRRTQEQSRPSSYRLCIDVQGAVPPALLWAERLLRPTCMTPKASNSCLTSQTEGRICILMQVMRSGGNRAEAWHKSDNQRERLSQTSSDGKAESGKPAQVQDPLPHRACVRLRGAKYTRPRRQDNRDCTGESECGNDDFDLQHLPLCSNSAFAVQSCFRPIEWKWQIFKKKWKIPVFFCGEGKII